MIQRLLCNHSCSISVLWNELRFVNNLSINNSIRKDFKVREVRQTCKIFREELELQSQNFILHYLLAVLNSSVARYFLNRNRRSQLGFYPDDIKKLPVKITSRENQLAIKQLTLYITSCTGEENISAFHFFDKLIDSAVYQVYFPESFTNADIEVLKYVSAFPSFNDDSTAEEKLNKHLNYTIRFCNHLLKS